MAFTGDDQENLNAAKHNIQQFASLLTDNENANQTVTEIIKFLDQYSQKAPPLSNHVQEQKKDDFDIKLGCLFNKDEVSHFAQYYKKYKENAKQPIGNRQSFLNPDDARSITAFNKVFADNTASNLPGDEAFVMWMLLTQCYAYEKYKADKFGEEKQKAANLGDQAKKTDRGQKQAAIKEFTTLLYDETDADSSLPDISKFAQIIENLKNDKTSIFHPARTNLEADKLRHRWMHERSIKKNFNVGYISYKGPASGVMPTQMNSATSSTSQQRTAKFHIEGMTMDEAKTALDKNPLILTSNDGKQRYQIALEQASQDGLTYKFVKIPVDEDNNPNPNGKSHLSSTDCRSVMKKLGGTEGEAVADHIQAYFNDALKARGLTPVAELLHPPKPVAGASVIPKAK